MTAQSVLEPKVTEEKMGTGIGADKTRSLADNLANALADSYVLYLETQGVHWNVVGPTFYGVHKLTETQYEDLAGAIDELAERIRALGFPAPASFGEFKDNTILESSKCAGTAADMLKKLVDDHTAVAKRLRGAVRAAEDVDDVVTADLLTERIGVHEEAAWMLRSMIAE